MVEDADNTMPRRRPSGAEQTIGLVVAFTITFSAAAIGAVASVGAQTFYAELERPPWAPPGAWFGPVWTGLYALMAISVWLVWRETGIRRAGVALPLFMAQLIVNALWSWLFFAWRLGAAALVDAIVLGSLIAVVAVLFWRTSRVAALLLVPYLAWVGFAVALTYAVWQRNPGLLG